ncbi:MAG: hypothetical protein HY816_20100 [Candidatus Wallbacteria bacterium]|nr:hypothetical protein [Candidatus Wallbacteria bacterium]
MNNSLRFDADTARVFVDEHGGLMLDYAIFESETEYSGTGVYPALEPFRIDPALVGREGRPWA